MQSLFTLSIAPVSAGAVTHRTNPIKRHTTPTAALKPVGGFTPQISKTVFNHFTPRKTVVPQMMASGCTKGRIL